MTNNSEKQKEKKRERKNGNKMIVSILKTIGGSFVQIEN